MPRTTLAVIEAPGNANYTGTVLTMTAADATNDNDCAFTGREMIIAHNTGASGVVVTVTSSADSIGRTKDATVTIAAGAYHIFGPFQLTGWRQTGGKLHFDAAAADVKFAVVRT